MYCTLVHATSHAPTNMVICDASYIRPLSSYPHWCTFRRYMHVSWFRSWLGIPFRYSSPSAPQKCIQWVFMDGGERSGSVLYAINFSQNEYHCSALFLWKALLLFYWKFPSSFYAFIFYVLNRRVVSGSPASSSWVRGLSPNKSKVARKSVRETSAPIVVCVVWNKQKRREILIWTYSYDTIQCTTR